MRAYVCVCVTSSQKVQINNNIKIGVQLTVYCYPGQ